MEYYSCPMIDGFYLNFGRRIDDEKNAIALCCEPLDGVPGVPIAETPEETLRSFVGERFLTIAEGIRRTADPERKNYFSDTCAKCVRYKKAKWNTSVLIGYVNLSMYPSPCQCRCIYCEVYKKNDVYQQEKVKKAYDTLFATLELAKSTGIIMPNATWQVSCGEITIHPYRQRILELVRGERAIFYTNCFKFDEDIAQNLHENPGSAINLSIDAGTSATWKKIKGFDNFEEVTSNLVKYYVAAGRDGQITLKYIVLPGLNDIYEDYISLMEIMKVLHVSQLVISRDSRYKYNQTPQEKEAMLGAAAYLVAICHKNHVAIDMFAYSAEEQQQTVKLAKELLQKGQI